MWLYQNHVMYLLPEPCDITLPEPCDVSPTRTMWNNSTRTKWCISYQNHVMYLLSEPCNVTTYKTMWCDSNRIMGSDSMLDCVYGRGFLVRSPLLPSLRPISEPTVRRAELTMPPPLPPFLRGCVIAETDFIPSFILLLVVTFIWFLMHLKINLNPTSYGHEGTNGINFVGFILVLQ